MELFHKYRNRSVQAFIKLAERVSAGEELSVNEFEAEYYRLSGDSKRITSIFYQNVVDNTNLPIFDLRDKKRVRLCIELSPEQKIHISDIVLKPEKYWLSAALKDKLSSLFLSDEESALLEPELSGSPDYYRHIDDSWRSSENITEQAAENFRLILRAINEGQALSYTYNAQNCEGVPVRIEYDERTCEIYMILHNGSRFVKSDITKLSEIRETENNFGDIPEIKEGMINKKAYRPVVFTVTDNKNRKAVDRALLAFSVYDHIVEPIDEKSARFTIQYYTMDLDILIKDILSFGPDIIVESPGYVVKRITDILKKL